MPRYSAIALPLIAVASASPAEKFLQKATTASASPVPKTLRTSDEFIDQLNFAVTDDVFCGKTEVYTAVPELYGMIRGPVSDGEDFLNPSDKAVSWLSNHAFMESLVNKKSLCCNPGGPSSAEAMTHCACNVAAAVEISRVDGQYEIAAVHSTDAGVVPIQPKWGSTKFHEALAQSYSWVFHDAKLVLPLEDLQTSCQPSLATWAVLEDFNQQTKPGVEAYSAIMHNATYGVGVGGQMHQLGCEPTLDAETGKGGCGCKGTKDGRPYCQATTDVALFCGSGGLERCDPRPFLCPENELPVGFVRAYLHKFFDAIPFFHGTGFADESGEVPEFIVSPNVRAEKAGIKRTASQSLFDSCAA